MVLEAAAALGVASSVCQFVDFACKLISEANDTYKRGEGKSVKRIQLESSVENILALASGIRTSLDEAAIASRPSPEEATLQRICSDTLKAATRLQEALDRVVTVSGNRAWGSLREALGMMWNADKIDGILGSLSLCRSEMDTLILVIIRRRIDAVASVNHAIESQLKRVNIGQADLASELKTFMSANEKWQSDLIHAVYSERWTPLDHNERPNLDDIGKVSRKLMDAASQQRDIHLRGKLLRRLYFPSIRDREARIPAAHSRTFQWIFNQPSDMSHSRNNFARWLEGGNHIFWVTGKPASGKSTLMKFIQGHPATTQLIKRWARGAKKTIACTYFFWKAGHPLQKSQAGLLQTLLYDALRQLPGAVTRVFSERWENYVQYGDDARPLSWAELAAAFKTLTNTIAVESDIKLFMMIDGLDEAEDKYSDLVRLLQETVATSQHVKILLGSRPEQAFEDAFGRLPNLRMQDLTLPDILAYVDAELCTQPRFQDLKDMHPTASGELIVSIGKKASGVFLWVTLVVASLVEGLQNGDNIREIEQRLDRTPPELDELYFSMLASLDQAYFKQAAEMFLIKRAASEQLTLLDLCYAEKPDVEVMSSGLDITLNSETAKKRHGTTKRRLNSRCKGLLEASTGLAGQKILSQLNDAVQFETVNTQPSLVQADCVNDQRPTDELVHATDLNSPPSSQEAQQRIVDTTQLRREMSRACLGARNDLDAPYQPPEVLSPRPRGERRRWYAPRDREPQTIIDDATGGGRSGEFVGPSPSPYNTYEPRVTREGTNDFTSHDDAWLHDRPTMFMSPHTRVAADRQRRSEAQAAPKANFYRYRQRIDEPLSKLRFPRAPPSTDIAVEALYRNDGQRVLLQQASRCDAMQQFGLQDIDYLHRTAKDFLDRPDNLKMLHDAVDPTFDAKKALLKAGVLQLRVLPREGLDLIPLWAWISSCLRSAAAVQTSGGIVPQEWFDAIDRAAAHVFNLKGANGESLLDSHRKELRLAFDQASDQPSRKVETKDLVDYHWANTEPGRCGLGANFTTVCVQYNLVSCIKARISQGLRTERDDCGRPMLDYVYLTRHPHRINEDHISTASTTTTASAPQVLEPESPPDAAMITTLIAGGADPNVHYADGTPWQRTLSRMHAFYQRRARLDEWQHPDFQKWYDVYAAFIRGGADPRADLNAPSGSYAREIFQHWDAGKTAQLQRLMKMKGRKLPALGRKLFGT